MQNYFEKSEILISPHDQEQCALLLTAVEDKAPANSIVKLRIAQLPNGMYQTIFEVRAICGYFQAEAQHPFLIASCNRAQSNVLKIMHRWNVLRFSLDAGVN